MRRRTSQEFALFLVLVGTTMACGSGSANEDSGEPTTQETEIGTNTSDASAATTDSSTTTTMGDAESTTDSDSSGTRCESDLSYVSAEILIPKCSTSGCHDAKSNAGGLDLSIDPSLLPGQLIGRASGTCDGQALVVPGSRGQSFLYTKLLPSPACGLSMPVGTPLDEAEIECIGEWIDHLGNSESESGSDTGEPCETCGGLICIDLETDANHCGACGARCPSGISCVNGNCDCPGDLQQCGDQCVQWQSDPQHCGGCDFACGQDEVCLGGQCTSDCGALSECSGSCVDTMTDFMHCGACDRTCTAGQECNQGQCSCMGGPVSFEQEVLPILVEGCASNGCHGGKQPKDDLDLTSQRAYMELVDMDSVQCPNRSLVIPGDVDESYLYDKLLGVDMCSGTRMPKGAGPLTASELDLISRWICNGALDN